MSLGGGGGCSSPDLIGGGPPCQGGGPEVGGASGPQSGLRPPPLRGSPPDIMRGSRPSRGGSISGLLYTYGFLGGSRCGILVSSSNEGLLFGCPPPNSERCQLNGEGPPPVGDRNSGRPNSLPGKFGGGGGRNRPCACGGGVLGCSSLGGLNCCCPLSGPKNCLCPVGVNCPLLSCGSFFLSPNVLAIISAPSTARLVFLDAASVELGRLLGALSKEEGNCCEGGGRAMASVAPR